MMAGAQERVTGWERGGSMHCDGSRRFGYRRSRLVYRHAGARAAHRLRSMGGRREEGLTSVNPSSPAGRSGRSGAETTQGLAAPHKLAGGALLMSPLVITGEAAGGGALPLPFPTAHAPTLTSATEARMTTVISLPARVIRICVRSRWQGMRAEQMPGTTSARLNAHHIPSAVLHSAPTMPSIPNGTDRWTSDDELAMDF